MKCPCWSHTGARDCTCLPASHHPWLILWSSAGHSTLDNCFSCLSFKYLRLPFWFPPRWCTVLCSKHLRILWFFRLCPPLPPRAPNLVTQWESSLKQLSMPRRLLYGSPAWVSHFPHFSLRGSAISHAKVSSSFWLPQPPKCYFFGSLLTCSIYFTFTEKKRFHDKL